MGSLLLFALLVALVVYVQISIFPEINERTEVKGQANALESMKGIKIALEDVASQNRTQSVTYQNRITYIPQPAGPGAQLGQINMKNVSNPQISNLATSPSFVNGDGSFGSGRDTKILVYKPQFVELSEDREVVYENTVVAEKSPNQNDYVSTTSQDIISGTTINIIILTTNPEGPNGIQGSQPTITATPVNSGSATVTGSSGNNIELEFTSKYRQDKWSELLEPEENNGIVISVSKSGDRITVELDGSRTYNLKYSEVRVES